jgi:hypothetical protein
MAVASSTYKVISMTPMLRRIVRAIVGEGEGGADKDEVRGVIKTASMRNVVDLTVIDGHLKSLVHDRPVYRGVVHKGGTAQAPTPMRGVGP